MSFNYDKIKAKESDSVGSQWTAYSDLFMSLAVIFLLLYVVANLRSSSMGISTQIQLQEAEERVREARQAARVYEVLKDDYLERGASASDKKMYKELMDHLNLISDESRQKKEEFYKQFKQQKEQEDQLNKYQSVIRNILTANLAARSKLKTRDEIIQDKDKSIEELDRTVTEKEEKISENNREIESARRELNLSIQQLKFAYKSKARSKKVLQEKIEDLKRASAARIEDLNQENRKVGEELSLAKSEIEEKNRSLQQSQQKITKLSSDVELREQRIQGLKDTIESKENAIQGLKDAHRKKLEAERQAFEESLNKEKMSAQARVERERAFRKAREAEIARYNEQLGNLKGELGAIQSEAESAKGQLARERQQRASLEAANQRAAAELTEMKGALEGAQQEVQQSKQEVEATKQDLRAAQLKATARARLSQRLEENFKKSGISANINKKTGEVTVKFAGEYFDTGSSSLKKGMRSILEKVIPVYAETLFKDEKIAKKINTVEIIGFASPTYKGRYVDPNSLKADDRSAVSYNLDLSFNRAKSIFNHIFDTKKMQFSHQKRLQSMVKVSGRSFFSAKKLKPNDGREPADISQKEYCEVYDCKQSQKVIIKFDLD